MKLEKITDTDIILKEVKSRGVGVSDAIWSLVLGNIACLIRIRTMTINGKYRRIGCSVASSEASFNVAMSHAALNAFAHQMLHIDPAELYLQWHISDVGPGMEKGIRQFLSSDHRDLSTVDEGVTDDCTVVCHPDAPGGLYNGENGKTWNICFANSLIQCLKTLMPASDVSWCAQFDHGTVHKSLSSLLSWCGAHRDARELVALVSKAGPLDFTIGLQEDPGECFCQLQACLEGEAQKRSVCTEEGYVEATWCV